MPQWIVDIVGESLAPIVWVAIVAVVVCLLAIVVILLAKKAFGGSGGGGFKGRAPRLAVMDVARIDEKRRLILVRRDEVEHLVLVGGQTDLLLEGNILRLPAAARARNEPQLDRLPEPEDDPAVRRWELPAGGAERQAPSREIPLPVPVRHEPRQQERSASTQPDADSMPSPVAAPAPGPVVAPARAADPVRASSAPAANRTEPNGGHSTAPSVQPTPPVQQRSLATPTLPVAAPKDVAVAAPATPQAPASSQQDGGRVEPSLTMPEARPTTTAPDMTRQRAEIRDRLNRAPASDVARTQNAPAAETDKAAGTPPERRPLSVRSFATAIQNRGATLEPRAPAVPPIPPIAASPVAPTREETAPGASAAAPTAEPSLQDFLSAELDAELSRDETFPVARASDDRVAAQRPTNGAGASMSPEPERQSGSPAPVTHPSIAAEPDRASLPAAASKPLEEPARKLTLEEEMERLLGDFSFGDNEQRNRG